MRDGDQMSACLFFFLTEGDEVERTWRRGHASELAEPGPHPRPALLLLAGRLSIFLSASAVSGGDNTDRPRGRGPARGCAEGARRRSALLPSCPAGRTFAARPPEPASFSLARFLSRGLFLRRFHLSFPLRGLDPFRRLRLSLSQAQYFKN